jgi:hypothetical protein
MCAILLIRGASESAKVDAVMVVIKLGVLVMFIAIDRGDDRAEAMDDAVAGEDRRRICQVG